MSNKEIVITEEIFQIPIEGLFPTFESFLQTENNNRVFFSGKFGIGKTFFLKKFFDTKTDDYDVYHLFPVNYQIHQNEDIFELIKFDILTELINKNPDIFKNNKLQDFVDLQNLLYIWGKDNWVEISKTIISNIPRLGKPLKDIISLTQQFGKFAEDVQGGEKLTIDNYLKDTKEKSSTETDRISNLIKGKVINQKAKKQSVLVLDDLDRVDPEHIFRLLNVFSAYFEKEHDNKFGFDKVILVGHEENIRSIFYHKYGEKTDFEGYFDKFFSLYVYVFDNKSEITSNLDKLLYQIKHGESLEDALTRSGYIHIFLLEILRRGVSVTTDNKINLRTLYKGVHFELPATTSYKQQQFYRNEGSQLMDTGMKILLQSLGGNKNLLLEVLKQCRKSVVAGVTFDRGTPHKVFSIAMLQKMYGRSRLNDEKAKHIDFGEHKIELTNVEDTQNPFNVENESLLFYDLLTDYIERDLHLQKVDRY